MGAMKERLIGMQKSLNQTCHLRSLKERELERLDNLLSDMMMETGEDDFMQKTVQQREGELEETLQGLSNELYYQETLQYMLEQRRLSILAIKKPINHLKKDLVRMKQDIATIKMHNRRARTASTFFEKAIEEFKQATLETKTLKAKAIDEDVEQIKNRGRLDMLLSKEQDFHREANKRTLLSKQLKSMETDLERLKDEEVIFDEIKQIENHVINEERKFKKIQSVTNISSIVDMEPYWNYLVENRERLEKAVQQAQVQIEELSQERALAEQELHSLTLETEERKRLNPREVELQEEEIKTKTKLLEDGESTVAHLNELIASATNTISRIAFQLADRPENVTVQTSSLVENLTFCGIKLEQMLASLLKRNVMYLEESINSDIQVRAPPDYMHINFESFVRHDDETVRSEPGDTDRQEVESIKQDRLRAKAGDARLREAKPSSPPEFDQGSKGSTKRIKSQAV